TRPYPGVEDALAALAARGVACSVLTNKPEAMSRAILTGLGLAARFVAILGGDSLPARKPDPAGLEQLRALTATARERILLEAARASVWVTVAFVERDLVLPGARGTFFDLLERAAARGLEVRALFWREPELGRLLPGASHFAGSAEERAWLAARGARFLARWD